MLEDVTFDALTLSGGAFGAKKKIFLDNLFVNTMSIFPHLLL